MDETQNSNVIPAKRFLDGSFILCTLVVLSSTWAVTAQCIDGAVYAGLLAGVTAGFLALKAKQG